LIQNYNSLLEDQSKTKAGNVMNMTQTADSVSSCRGSWGLLLRGPGLNFGPV